jgi:segregation and condensation protein B
MTELKQKIEAILFSAGKEVRIDELVKICRANAEEIKQAVQELKAQYNNSPAIMLVEEGDAWKLTVREAHLPLVRRVVKQTELTKTLIETLAVVAWRAPALQSDIIKIRTNKAYDHLRLLEEKGFITRKKHSRTQLINLSQKFFDYFDLKDKEAMQEKLGKVEEKLIEKKFLSAAAESAKLKQAIEKAENQK